MVDQIKHIEEFFRTYEENFNDALSGNVDNIGEILSGSFSDCFIESSPAGVNCGKNDAQFINVIKQGILFYKTIGSESMHVTDTDITLLDQMHAMCKVSWKYSYKKDAHQGTIDFFVIYFLRFTGNEVKIFAYIAGDEQKALREAGLV